MKSKFTVKSYLILPLTLAVIFLIINVVPSFWSNPYYDGELFPKIFLPSILFFTFLILFFGELRTKFISVKIRENDIIVKKFLGIKTEVYKMHEIKGWKYSHLSSRGGTYEYLYLYQDDKKIIKISEFYHKNYFQLKNKIQANYKYLGYENFSLVDEFKEIFT